VDDRIEPGVIHWPNDGVHVIVHDDGRQQFETNAVEMPKDAQHDVAFVG
jgi:hypothetical protein